MAKGEVNRSINKWTARVMPLIISTMIGYATYVYIDKVCVHYLIHPPRLSDVRAQTHQQPQPHKATAIGLLVGYGILLVLMMITYYRLVYMVQLRPGFTPIGPTAIRDSGIGKEAYRPPSEQSNTKSKEPMSPSQISNQTLVEPGPEYQSSSRATNPISQTNIRQQLTQTFLRDMFTCDVNGEPRWCPKCGNWKPDRTHHCSEVNRCVEGFDHFCPWVGGVVGLTSYKFFVQFVAYASMYCLYIVISMAVLFRIKLSQYGWQNGTDADWVAVFAMGGMFGTFVCGMLLSNSQMIHWGVTTNENFMKHSKRYYIARLDPDQSTIPKVNPNARPKPPTSTQQQGEIPPWQPADPEENQPTGYQRRVLVPIHITHVVPASPTTLSDSAVPPPSEVVKHYYRIYLTPPGLNPWRLGFTNTAIDVLGPRVWDWFLPIHTPYYRPHDDHNTVNGRWSDKKLRRALKEEGWVRGDAGAARARQNGMRCWYEWSDELLQFINECDHKEEEAEAMREKKATRRQRRRRSRHRTKSISGPEMEPESDVEREPEVVQPSAAVAVQAEPEIRPPTPPPKPERPL